MNDDTQRVVDAVTRVADHLIQDADTLTELDSEIGDADFGVNLERGLEAVLEELEAEEFEEPDQVLNATGQALISEMAGSSGILFGKSLMEASSAITDGLNLDSLVEFAERYRDNVAEQGDVDVGAKTMFDAIQPTVYALKRGQALEETGPVETSAQTVKACEYGVGFTIPLRAKKGRASYTEWRSVGYPDPGAVSVLLAVRELHEFVQEEHGTDVDPYLPGSLEDLP